MATSTLPSQATRIPKAEAKADADADATPCPEPTCKASGCVEKVSEYTALVCKACAATFCRKHWDEEGVFTPCFCDGNDCEEGVCGDCAAEGYFVRTDCCRGEILRAHCAQFIQDGRLVTVCGRQCPSMFY